MHAEAHADIETAAASWVGEGSKVSSQTAVQNPLRGRGGYATEPANAGMVSLDVELLLVPRCVSGGANNLFGSERRGGHDIEEF